MRPFRRAATPAAAEPEPFRVDLGRLRLDVEHKVTHAYEPRPQPKYVMLEFRAADTNEILGRYPAEYSGYTVRVPRWVMTRATEHGADELDVVVTW